MPVSTTKTGSRVEIDGEPGTPTRLRTGVPYAITFPSPTGAVEVLVVDHEGAPVPAVAVRLHLRPANGARMNLARTLQTDAAGRALFEEVPLGTARLRLESLPSSLRGSAAPPDQHSLRLRFDRKERALQVKADGRETVRVQVRHEHAEGATAAFVRGIQRLGGASLSTLSALLRA